jgi:protein-L-isoaspartate(D-aspartate) O-methyltransferase
MLDFPALRLRMVDNQIRPSEVTDLDVIRAFSTVPREIFVDPAERPFAYADRELRLTPYAGGRRMMDPVQLARLVHALPRGGDVKAMVVGGGTGYSAAILSHLAGSIVMVEQDERLATEARERMRDLGLGNVSVVSAGLTEGHPAGGPYDAILIEGAVEMPPATLLGQLKPGGLLATVERDDRLSRAVLYERVGDDIAKWPQFDAWATLLPGFERHREFVF